MDWTKREILTDLSFGRRIAEEEVEHLASYFVETDHWRRIFRGEVDVVYGPKGAGKSAIYSLLLKRADELSKRGIFAIAAENPRGAPVFKDLVETPPTSESEFRNLWKLYLLMLVAEFLRERSVRGEDADFVTTSLEKVGLLDADTSLKSKLKKALDYIRQSAPVESVEASVGVEPATMTHTASGKITFREPSSAEKVQGVRSVDDILKHANRALRANHLTVWILIDRLDVAFAENEELEANALRALFRVYLDIQANPHIVPKIFLRSDIWRKLTQQGFREASHITKSLTIQWNEQSLLNLVVRRILQNPRLVEHYGVDPIGVMKDALKQRELFYRIFPEQVDSGPNKPNTFDWMLSRTTDATGRNAPRELIHLLSAARDAELRRIEVGHEEPPDSHLFERVAIKEALPEVSQARLEQTLYAEFPYLRECLEHLRGKKTQQSLTSLSAIWAVDETRALEMAKTLMAIGFFQIRRGPSAVIEFWVPFLYRDGLDMVQGAEE